MDVHVCREGQEADCDSSSMRELQRTICLGNQAVEGNNISNRSYLELLERRLRRVRSWGGPFGQIDFSPDVKALIKDGREVSSQKYQAKMLV